MIGGGSYGPVWQEVPEDTFKYASEESVVSALHCESSNDCYLHFFLCSLLRGITIFLVLQLKTWVVIKLFFFYLPHLVNDHVLSEIFPAVCPFVTFCSHPHCLGLLSGSYTSYLDFFNNLLTVPVIFFFSCAPFTLPRELRSWITDLTSSLSWHSPPPHSPIGYNKKPQMCALTASWNTPAPYLPIELSCTWFREVLGIYLTCSPLVSILFVIHTLSPAISLWI